MDGIEKITARISSDVHSEISEIEAEALRQVGEIRQKYQETAEQERNAILERGRLAAEEREHRLASVAALEAKKQTLSVKQELITQVFTKAEEKLRHLNEEEYVSLLASLATSAAKTGSEQIILSPKDKERYGAAVVALANKRLPNAQFTLAEGSRAINGGLLLSTGNVEINCAFESLIQQLRGELTPQVAQILFAVE